MRLVSLIMMLHSVLECFGTSSIDLVSAVNKIHYDGVDYLLESGPIAEGMFQEISDVQLGRKDNEWCSIVR